MAKKQRKPFTLRCQHCGQEFHLTAMSGATGAMRRHAKTHKGATVPLRYVFTRMAGQDVMVSYGYATL